MTFAHKCEPPPPRRPSWAKEDRVFNKTLQSVQGRHDPREVAAAEACPTATPTRTRQDRGAERTENPFQVCEIIVNFIIIIVVRKAATAPLLAGICTFIFDVGGRCPSFPRYHSSSYLWVF